MATLRKQVSDALCAQGYRRRGRAHLLRVDDDFSFCVDTGIPGPRTDIAPYVGIRSELVESTRSELMALEHDEWVGTAGANVGYILEGEYRYWDTGTSAQLVLDRISSALDKFRPFMSLATLHQAFSFRGAAENPGTPYALVVIALLNGDTDLVAGRLAEASRIFCGTSLPTEAPLPDSERRLDEVCDQFREFEARVRLRLER